MSQFDDLEITLGESVRARRIDQRLTQVELAARANVSLGAVKNLENGRGSTTKTLVRVVHVLSQDHWLSALAPSETNFNPLVLLESPSSKNERAPRRVRRTERA
jgi:transcriptional regulator with XRE-family HTH domain